jgi:hypothetical protein
VLAVSPIPCFLRAVGQLNEQEKIKSIFGQKAYLGPHTGTFLAPDFFQKFLRNKFPEKVCTRLSRRLQRRRLCGFASKSVPVLGTVGKRQAVGQRMAFGTVAAVREEIASDGRSSGGNHREHAVVL